MWPGRAQDIRLHRDSRRAQLHFPRLALQFTLVSLLFPAGDRRFTEPGLHFSEPNRDFPGAPLDFLLPAGRLIAVERQFPGPLALIPTRYDRVSTVQVDFPAVHAHVTTPLMN